MRHKRRTMLKRIGYFVVGSLVAGLFTTSAAPQQEDVMHLPCSDRDAMIATLKYDFDETKVGSGVTTTGRVLELYVSPKGDWALLVDAPTGPACVLASGDGWKPQPNRKTP
ncbi:MAG TPA: hypothetical protein VEJ16_05215 [Alphaproteobacteria bacterium]|nr:hypothetical protein [Alphaproteobacteria bacterium]